MLNFQQVHSSDIHVEISSAFIDVLPDTCPFCSSIVHFRVVNIFETEPDNYKGGDIQLLLQCPKIGCRKFSMGLYRRNSEDVQRIEGYEHQEYTYPAYSLYAVLPEAPLSLKTKTFSEEIERVSSQFSIIYNQAYAAEQMKLDQIAGMGYRKSLEFLVKDYASYKSPSKENEIRKLGLAKCIQTHIDDPMLKEVVERAVWLGNDETHYSRVWQDKDITDLKNLIELTVNGVTRLLLYDKYKSEMPHPKAG